MITEQQARRFLEIKRNQGFSAAEAEQALRDATAVLQRKQEAAHPQKTPSGSSGSWDDDPRVRRAKKTLGQQEQPQQQEGGFLSRAKDRWEEVKQSTARAVEGEIDAGSWMLGTAGKAVGQTLDTAVSGAIGLGKGIVKAVPGEWAENTLSAVGKGIIKAPGAISDAILQQPQGTTNRQAAQAVGMIAKGYEGLEQKYPDATYALEGAAEIGSLFPVGKGAQLAAKGAQRAGMAAAEGAAGVAARAAQAAPIATRVVLSPLKAVGGAYRFIDDTTKFAISKTTGLSRETIDNLLKNPKLIAQFDDANIDRMDLLNTVLRDIDIKKGELSATGKVYQTVREQPGAFSIDIAPIKQRLQKEGGIIVRPDNTLDFSKSRFSAPADIRAISETWDDLSRQTQMSGDDLLNLRMRVDGRINWKSGTNIPAALFVKDMRKTVDMEAKKVIPGLAELDAKYSADRKFLNEIDKIVRTRDGELKDNAVSQIANLANRGNEFKLQRLERLQPGIGERVRALRALEDVEISAGNKVGAYAQSLIFGGGMAMGTGNPVVGVMAAILANPKVAKSLLINYATAKNATREAISGTVRRITGKISKGVRLNAQEGKTMVEAMELEAKKAAIESAQEMQPRNPLPAPQTAAQLPFDPMTTANRETTTALPTRTALSGQTDLPEQMPAGIRPSGAGKSIADSAPNPAMRQPSAQPQAAMPPQAISSPVQAQPPASGMKGTRIPETAMVELPDGTIRVDADAAVAMVREKMGGVDAVVPIKSLKYKVKPGATDADVKAMRRSIKEMRKEGLSDDEIASRFPPLAVSKDNLIIDGDHRARAFELEKITEIPVVKATKEIGKAPAKTATTAAIPKELEPFAEEARKFKSADDFVANFEKPMASRGNNQETLNKLLRERQTLTKDIEDKFYLEKGIKDSRGKVLRDATQSEADELFDVRIRNATKAITKQINELEDMGTPFSTLNSTVLLKLPKEKSFFNFIKEKTTLDTSSNEAFLRDFWKQVTQENPPSSSLPKAIESGSMKESNLPKTNMKASSNALLAEAKKYKTAEDFAVASIVNARKRHYTWNKYSGVRDEQYFPETSRLFKETNYGKHLDYIKENADEIINAVKNAKIPTKPKWEDVDGNYDKKVVIPINDRVELHLNKKSEYFASEYFADESYRLFIMIDGLVANDFSGDTLRELSKNIKSARYILLDTNRHSDDVLNKLNNAARKFSDDVDKISASAIKEIEDNMQGTVSVDIISKLNANDRKAAEHLSKAWTFNNDAVHGYGEDKTELDKLLYQKKSEHIQKAIDIIEKSNTSQIRYGIEADKNIIYFDVGGRQVSFHYKGEAPTTKKTDMRWVGKRINENPLSLSDGEYNDFLKDAKDGGAGVYDVTEKRLIDIWKQANPTTPQSTGASGLIAEAKKYKTAEEFIKAQQPEKYPLKSGVKQDYMSGHEAPMANEGTPIWDLTGKYTTDGAYPDDIYSYEARRLYAAGEDYDGHAISIMQSLKDKPNAKVTIYRAVAKDTKGKINPGDWVSISRQYAVDHGESNLGGKGKYKILKQEVYARDLFTDANSIHEFGYDPQPRLPAKELPFGILKRYLDAEKANMHTGYILDMKELWQKAHQQ